MNKGQLPTNQLHNINWDALDTASPASQLMSCNYYAITIAPRWKPIFVECYYRRWCSMLGDLIIPVDLMSISLGMGLSITLKAAVEQLRWLRGVTQRSEHWLMQEIRVRFPVAALGFLLQLAY